MIHPPSIEFWRKPLNAMIMYINGINPYTLIVSALNLPTGAVSSIRIVTDKGDHSVTPFDPLAATRLPLRIPGRFDRHVGELKGGVVLLRLVNEIVPGKPVLDREADEYLFQCGGFWWQLK